MTPDWSELGEYNRQWIRRFNEEKFIQERKKKQQREFRRMLIINVILILSCTLLGYMYITR